MFSFLLDWLTWALTAGGLLGFFVIVILENFIVPFPSEMVLPFAGYLAYSGNYAFWTVVVVSVVAAVIGSLLSYALGRYGGQPFIKRYGHWFLLHPDDLTRAHEWFVRRGAFAVFICRFIPGVRQISSIPAGAARMPIGSFIFWTALGSAIWNLSLITVGYKLGAAWERVTHYTKFFDGIVIALFIIVVVYWWLRHGKALLAERQKMQRAQKTRVAQSAKPKKRRT